jgi:hypothetical protein
MYETPTIEAVGRASELIQFFAGLSTDGNGLPNSQGGEICSALEEE